jgi:transcriptional regulator with XRE-family HTH domain
MKYAEKLYKQMLLRGLNQQRLARDSRVSDSEVSRILGGKSQPGLENAFRLARAVGVSLDFLADDSLVTDPLQPNAETTSSSEREVVSLARELGFSSVVRLLEIARLLGYEAAMRRLIGADGKTGSEPSSTSTPTSLAAAAALQFPAAAGQSSSA